MHIIQIEQTPPTEACEEPMLAVVDYEGLQELFEAEPRRRSGPKTRSSTRRSTVAEETGDDSEEWRPRARSTTPRPTRTRTGTKSQTSGTSRSNVSTRRTTKTSQAARAHQQQEDELCGMMDDFDIVSNVGGPVPSECELMLKS